MHLTTQGRLIALLLALSTDLAAQNPVEKTEELGVQPAPQSDPADFGLMLPDAEPKPGGDRLVLVTSPDDELVVAKTLVEVGDQLVVILPDGRHWRQEQESKLPGSVFVTQAFANARSAELFAKSWLGK